MTLAQINQELSKPRTDPFGNTLEGSSTANGTTLLLTTPEGRKRTIGTLQVIKEEVWLVKFEKEQHIQKSPLSWSVPDWLLNLISKIWYHSLKADYLLTTEQVKKHGIRLYHQKGYDSKVHVPIEYWRVIPKSDYDKKLLSKLGREWWILLGEWLGKQTALWNGWKALEPKYRTHLFDAYQTTYNGVRVVIPQLGKTDGLAWSGESILDKEIEADCYYGNVYEPDYSRKRWAAQGVFLPVLEWNEGENSLAEEAIYKLTLRKNPPIIVCMGTLMQQRLAPMMDLTKVPLVTVADPLTHPGDFYGSNLFSRINRLLTSKPVTW